MWITNLLRILKLFLNIIFLYLSFEFESIHLIYWSSRYISIFFWNIKIDMLLLLQQFSALWKCLSYFIYIYIYAFSRRFYPKRLTLHSSYSFYILSALAFPGNRTHDLGVANAMLYQLSYRKAILYLYMCLISCITPFIHNSNSYFVCWR